MANETGAAVLLIAANAHGCSECAQCGAALLTLPEEIEGLCESCQATDDAWWRRDHEWQRAAKG